MSKPLRILFAGTPDFALPSLEACQQPGTEVVAVFTQPDRKAGRGRKLRASPVKLAAQTAGYPVYQPASMRTPQTLELLQQLAPDLIIVVAYGQILPQHVLDSASFGCWNVHASLLPRWRGAAPIQRAIQAGDTHTGVSLMQMQAGLDTGPVLLQASTPIAADDTGGSVHDRLATQGAELLARGIAVLQDGGKLDTTCQDERRVTYAHKLSKHEAILDMHADAASLERTIRAFDPWPGARLHLNGELVRISKAGYQAQTSSLAAGTIVQANKHSIDIACGTGVLQIYQLQRPGGRTISARDYLNAFPDLRS